MLSIGLSMAICSYACLLLFLFVGNEKVEMSTTMMRSVVMMMMVAVNLQACLQSRLEEPLAMKPRGATNLLQLLEQLWLRSLAAWLGSLRSWKDKPFLGGMRLARPQRPHEIP